MSDKALPIRHPSFILTTVVAGAFVTVVGILLLYNFVHRVPDPLETPGYLALKNDLKAQPDNDGLRQRIRDLDWDLRRDYFRRRRFSVLGTYLLLGGLAIAAAAAKIGTTLQRRLPQPGSPNALEERDERGVQLALWGVTGVLLLLVLASLGLWANDDSVLTADAVQVASGGDDSEQPLGNVTSPQNVSEAVTDPDTSESPRGDSREQWARFRGFQGAGISATADMPTAFDASSGEGILWSVEVPLPGKNSPICWGDNVFLSGATEHRREVYCYDADTGELRWGRELPKFASDAEPPEVSEDTGFAAPTMVTDGRLAFASFANGDVAAFDFNGQQAWFRSLGVPKNAYGHAASLAINNGFLFVQMDQGGRNDDLSKLYALQATSGETAWEAAREVPNSWSSPIVIVHNEKPQLITCAAPWVIAYDPQTGDEIWRCESLSQDVGPSPVYANDLVYVANEYPGVTAVRPDGQGNVTETHTVWFSDWGAPDTCSPLVVDDMLLLLTSFGTLMAFDAVDGGEDPLWEEEIDDTFRASPGLAGENVYLFGESGKVWILNVNREGCTTLNTSELGEVCVTSPAFHQGRIYIRGEEHLLCIGDE
jgi:outer membrane protein assembly factor BamB